MNPFLERVAKQGISHGRKSEKRAAKSLGAELHMASGARPSKKSDATLKTNSKNFRLEMKSTITQTMALDQGWLAKIAKEALAHGQQPVIVIAFVDAEGKLTQRLYGEWVIIPKEVFKELVD